MTDAPKSPALVKAEAQLKSLERFKVAVADANIALRAAESLGDKDKISAANAVYLAAAKADQESGITDRDIAEASQAVLDARGEAHTEVNVLPSDFGLRSVEANSDLATALGRNNPKRVEAAQAALTDAEAADAKEKSEHVASAPARTLAAQEGSAS